MFFIRSSLSSTRKLFQRTIRSVKSLFIERTTYQRLSKLPPSKPFSSQSFHELDRFYSDPNEEILCRNLEEIRNDHKNNDEEKKNKKNRLIAYDEMLEEDVIEKRFLVTNKLKDLGMIDSKDLDNVHDIEEVLHLYSLLTCPVYIDMFDKFVIDMYSDIFNLKASSHQKINSTISSRSRLSHSSLFRS